MDRRRRAAWVIAVCLAGASGAAVAGAQTFDVSELDGSVGPCQDLDHFVNARWIAANPIPPDRNRWGMFQIAAERSQTAQRGILERADAAADHAPDGSVQQQLGWFYRSGMDQAAVDRAGLAPIEPQLKAIAGLQRSADVVEYITAAIARGEASVFSFGSDADFRNASVRVAYARQSGLGLPTKDYYDQPDFATLRRQYQAHIAAVLRLAAPAGAKAYDAASDAARVMAVETRLARASFSPVELRTPEHQYHWLSVDDADRATPHVAWSTFLARQGVHADGLSLSQPAFFAEFDAMLASVPIADWRAYLRFHAIDQASPYLAAPFEDEHFAFYNQTLTGQQAQQPRWRRVLQTIDDPSTGMGMALGELYVRDHFPPAAKARAQQLVENLRLAMRTHLERVDWMGADTRRMALAKWATFLPKIGFPDTWRTWDALQIRPDGYYANVAAAMAYNQADDVARIGRPTDRRVWQMTPQTVNAYYDPTENTVNFPAAILQPPFFDADADDALNYGGIGAVIGHEMSHGFDDEGSQFDAAGNNVNWWTPEDRAAFDARSAKLVAQFDALEPLPGVHVNGRLTLGENIADLGGLSLAHDALLTVLAENPVQSRARIDGYTQDQRFFMNWARIWRAHTRPEALRAGLAGDPHAPSRARANGAPSNLPSFARAFECKAGDPMVRPDASRVGIW